MRKQLQRLSAGVLYLLSVGCNGRREPAMAARGRVAFSDAAAPASMAASAASMPMAEPALTQSGAVPPPSGVVPPAIVQKLIRRGELRIRVGDARRAAQQADSAVRTAGGVLADSRQQQDPDGHREATLVARIPADRFDDAAAALRKLGDVRSETVNAQDITREYADVATRRAVQEQTVTRLRALLDTHAAKLSDVLEVERELARTITGLEQLEGEQRYYDQQVAMSSITIALFERDRPVTAGFSELVSNAFHGALETLGESLATAISAVVFLVPWLVMIAICWPIVMRLRRRSMPIDASSAPIAHDSAP